MKTELQISGMTCPSCAGTVQRALQTAGAGDIHVDWRTGTATGETNGRRRGRSHKPWTARCTGSSESSSRAHAQA